jgi:hypothetical protein
MDKLVCRKLAAHVVLTPDGQRLKMGVVELDTRGDVKRWYRLEGEQAHTTWLGGTIEIRSEGESLKAYKNNKPI